MKKKIILLSLPLLALAGGGVSYALMNNEKSVEHSVAQIIEAPTSDTVEEVEVETPIVEETTVTRTAPEQETVDSVDILPEWQRFLEEQNLKGSAHMEAVDCILNWGNYLTPASALAMHPIGVFMQSAEDYKNDKAAELFEHTLQNRPCFGQSIR